MSGGGDLRRRVKLYALNDARTWDDKGTGHVTSCYHEPLDGISLLVRDESDGSLLLESKIQLDTQYQKQQGTLIVWTESDSNDLALSFQTAEGCNEIWEKICDVQGKDPSYCGTNEDEDSEDVRIELVPCDVSNLSFIYEQIDAFSHTSRRREVLVEELIQNEYITKLLEIFKESEKKQDAAALHKLYEIFKQLFMSDKAPLIEEMLSDDNLMNIIGVFEYDPATTQKSLDDRKKHREYLDNSTTFKEVIPFNNQNLVNKIHQTYRVQYLQSSILPAPSIIDENAYAALTNILFFNKVEIVSMIQENETFLKTLFIQIMSNEVDTDRKRDLMLFLKEFCTFSQNIQPKQRDIFFKTLTKLGILSLIEITLKITDPVIKSAAIDIFTYLVDYSPQLTREHAVHQQQQQEYNVEDERVVDSEEVENIDEEKERTEVEAETETKNETKVENETETENEIKTETENENDAENKITDNNIKDETIETKPQADNLLKLVIDHITHDEDPELGTATQLSQIIRILSDPENIGGEDREKNRFLDFFYKECMSLLLKPIEDAVSGNKESSLNDRSTAQLLSIVLDLLTFFVEHHQMHLRNYISSGDLLAKIITLLESRHTFLRLSVIKFVRRLVAVKFYNDIIVSENLFGPVIEVLKKNQGRYNLLDSAILEMFEHIRNEDMLTLMNYTFQNFGDQVDQIDYVNTFETMKERRDSLLEGLNGCNKTKADESTVECFEGLPNSNSARKRIRIENDMIHRLDLN